MEWATQHIVELDNVPSLDSWLLALLQMSMGFWMRFLYIWNRTWKLCFLPFAFLYLICLCPLLLGLKYDGDCHGCGLHTQTVLYVFGNIGKKIVVSVSSAVLSCCKYRWEICATVIPLHSEFTWNMDIHMTQLTNSLVTFVMMRCYEGGLGFYAKTACTLSLEHQFNVCMAQHLLGTENIFEGNHFNSIRLQAKQRDISDVVEMNANKQSQLWRFASSYVWALR